MAMPPVVALMPTPPGQRRAGAQLAQVHSRAKVDVLVGTQMIAKGHDFRRITLVAAVQPDGRCSAVTSARPSGCLPC